MDTEKLLKKKARELTKKGFVIVGNGYDYFSRSYWIRLIHRNDFDVILLQEDIVDNEEFFNATFGISDEEVEERLIKKLGFSNIMNSQDKDMVTKKMFDWEDKDFRSVVTDLVKENKEILK